MFDQIRKGFAARHDPKLVAELLEAYTELKRNYYLGGLRLAEVEGGRFCEAAFRMLEERTRKQFTPIAKLIDTDALIDNLRSIPSNDQPDSVRLHIPRALRVIYDIRNKRDAAHLADYIDPNLQDATLVVSTADWVLAEFVRLYRSVTPAEAQSLVDGLVTRAVPAIQDFDGFLKVLNPKLSASNYLLVLLYQRGTEGATYDQLYQWSKPSMRGNLARTLRGLTDSQAFVHYDGKKYFITFSGVGSVESRKLLAMPSI